ncbi:MAG TPA: VOC family protein [Thermoleophilaceae bacterium]|jgi:catechol 2,3-dioxygenase-like lactoylglutathione lyase family enzyme|nr:VOC family protein [Thermoleophilaceae bacterium]
MALALFDHVDLVVGSIERSLPFYRDLLRPLGATDCQEVGGEQGETIYYIGGEGLPCVLGLREKRSDAHPAPYDRYGLGVHHLAFGAPSRELVDERAGWLRSRGVEIESGPAEYDYVPGYYAVFFYDPDRIKLEIVYKPGRSEAEPR